ncbi:sugar phosphate isomerase/epimerase [Roseisolibacter sp. H3M3-2]|uniref:sugar phosphate isomerase/epimerase family protein n=1 Tax=Roseisolibacter sp. H3M3-2 TaxID=3031323 RepID=UPI0023DB0C0E|nr:sugar phosphate isomerase/epimerase [Roseisolibacter sp. H3M3-2]MDF1501621.1 sugar phosphate isomerase/epimerase [Roseisolibacter sp. H3M3-2]
MPTDDPFAAPTRRAFLQALALPLLAPLAVPLAACTPRDPALDAGDTAAPAAPAATPAAAGPASTAAMRLGVQLYTLRDALGKDLEGTLAQLQQIGYRNVEPFTHHGKTPQEFRAILDRHQLAAPSAHVPIADLRASAERVLDAAATLGHQWVVIPWLDDKERTADGYKRVAGEMSRWGQLARARQIGLAYHNHDFEFAPIAGSTQTGWDILRAEADRELVKYELDVYWATKAGKDALAIMTAEPGRVTQIHAKDATAAPERKMVDVGAGTIDWATIVRQGRGVGLQNVFVEHDNPTDAIASARAGFTHLQSIVS